MTTPTMAKWATRNDDKPRFQYVIDRKNDDEFGDDDRGDLPPGAAIFVLMLFMVAFWISAAVICLLNWIFL
jgi:hypothetical protein